jgi:hypothetical protein
MPLLARPSPISWSVPETQQVIWEYDKDTYAQPLFIPDNAKRDEDPGV